MDIEKLIEQLRSAAKLEAYYNSEYNGLYNQTADALEKLQAENAQLRAELEQAKAERDGAAKDLNEFLAMDELCPIQCEWCKWNGTYCDGKTPEWRGIKED